MSACGANEIRSSDILTGHLATLLHLFTTCQKFLKHGHLTSLDRCNLRTSESHWLTFEPPAANHRVKEASKYNNTSFQNSYFQWMVRTFQPWKLVKWHWNAFCCAWTELCRKPVNANRALWALHCKEVSNCNTSLQNAHCMQWMVACSYLENM